MRLHLPFDFVRGALLRFLHSAGRTGLVGIALLVACGVIALRELPAVEDDIRALQAERSALRASTASKNTQHLDSRTVLANYYAQFPQRRQLPQQLVRLHKLADQHTLQAEQAEYRDSSETGTPLVRVRIEVPVSGNYVSLRAWISDCLRTMPTLALDGIQLRRADSGSPLITARVRFHLYLQAKS